MPLSSKSKGQWFLMTAVLVIAIILNIMLVVYRIYHVKLSSDWNDDAILFFLAMKDSVERMDYADPALRDFYYQMYERIAEERGIILNLTDSGGKTKISFFSPKLVVEQFV